MAEFAGRLTQSDNRKCFETALMRMAIVLNGHNKRLNKNWLRLTDDLFYRKLISNAQLKNYWRLNLRTIDESIDLKDVLEDYFYPHLNIKREGDGAYIDYELTSTFLEMTRSNFHLPNYSQQELEIKGSIRKFAIECQTNYLLKNFWHNFAHKELQKVTNEDYRRYGGQSEFEGDFEADNLATIFLIYSYGLPIFTNGPAPEARLPPRFRGDPKIIRKLRMNRCNQVFRARSENRRHPRVRGKENYLEDQEWRYRRELAVHVSGALIAMGLCAGTFSIYFMGDAVYDRAKNKFYRDNNNSVGATINGFRLFCNHPSLDPDEYNALSRQDRRAHFVDVGQSLWNEYLGILRQGRRYREHAARVLQLKFALAGVARSSKPA